MIAMTLKEKVESQIKAAMKAQDKKLLTALRGIKSLILLAETEKGAVETLTQETEVKLLTKAAKQRSDSAQIYKDQGRQDLYEVEIYEYEVISSFLPTMLSDEEIKAEVIKIIQETGATSAKDMGKVMGVASKALAGKAENSRISVIVKSLLP
jgi:uncharacterized protein YqeY